MRLSDTAIRKAKSKDKAFKLSDGGGLYLLVQPTGSKLWRYKYRFAGQEKLLAFGSYPAIGLLDAREKHLQARKALAAGKDPAVEQRATKRALAGNNTNGFEAVAREWMEKNSQKWSPFYADDVKNRLEKHIFPKLGPRPTGEITTTEILEILRIIEKSGALDMAHRMMQTCGQVFRYAVVTGRIERNPVSDLRGALKVPVKKNYAFLKENELPDFMKKLDAYDGHPRTRLALKFLLLCFVRTIELRGALLQEFNLDKAEWRIPPERMKMRSLHVVPLSKQAVAVIRELIAMNPERFAQEALGHNSKAVHRAYARRAQVELPALGEYEKRRAMFAGGKMAEPVAQVATA